MHCLPFLLTKNGQQFINLILKYWLKSVIILNYYLPTVHTRFEIHTVVIVEHRAKWFQWSINSTEIHVENYCNFSYTLILYHTYDARQKSISHLEALTNHDCNCYTLSQSYINEICVKAIYFENKVGIRLWAVVYT